MNGIIARKAFYDKFFLKPSMSGFLRLALSDSLSFNSHSGGSVENFKEKAFLKLKANHGLKQWYNDVLDIHSNGNHITRMLSVADLIQIGGAAAVQYSGGPEIDVKFGRESHKLANSTLFPDSDFGLKDFESMEKEMNLTSREIVALLGYRTLGFLNNGLENKEQRWSINPYVFDNNYFNELLTKNSPYLKTPSDNVLLKEEKYLKNVEEFANNETIFFQEFKQVYEKISCYGHQNLLSEYENSGSGSGSGSKCKMI